jgi:hypothetical protein
MPARSAASFFRLMYKREGLWLPTKTTARVGLIPRALSLAASCATFFSIFAAIALPSIIVVMAKQYHRYGFFARMVV